MKKIKLIDEANELQEVTVISRFLLAEFNNEYMIYHMDEIDERNMVKLYVGTITKDGKLLQIDTDREWASIKSVMKEMAVRGMTE